MVRETDNNNDYSIIEIHAPLCNLIKDSEDVIIKYDKAIKKYQEDYYASLFSGRYNDIYSSYFDDDDNDWDDEPETEGWQRHFDGFGMSDEEWDEWQNSIKEYENTIKDFERNTGYTIRNKKSNKKGKITSQKFINGIEVDDDEFERYNNKDKKTRRSGRKHHNRTIEIINGVRVESSPNKKRKTRYIGDEWDERHSDDRYHYPSINEHNSVRDNLKDVDKSIIFYRNLPDINDTYEWDNLYEFSEWLEENSIEVDDNTAYDIMYMGEVHCCMNPDSTSKSLIAKSNYDDLVYCATNGDLSMLEDTTNHWNYHGI